MIHRLAAAMLLAGVTIATAQPSADDVFGVPGDITSEQRHRRQLFAERAQEHRTKLIACVEEMLSSVMFGRDEIDFALNSAMAVCREHDQAMERDTRLALHGLPAAAADYLATARREVTERALRKLPLE